MSVLVIAEHDNHSVKPEFSKVLNAAWQLCQSPEMQVPGQECGIDILLLGSVSESLLESLAFNANINKIWVVEGISHVYQALTHLGRCLAGLVQEHGHYTHLVCATTPISKALMPNIAAHLDVDQISNVSAIESADTFVRPIYAGRLLNRVQSQDNIKLLSVVASSFDALPEAKRSERAEVTHVALPEPSESLQGEILNITQTESERPPLQSAKVVVSVGRGLVKSKDDIQRAEQLADSLGAAIGATRAVVDAGWMPNDKQVGQTAKIVSPDLYIALGVSGAAQHLAGMKNSKVIVAVNKDENAPIFKVAHYGLIADLVEVMPALQAQLSDESS
ncbi:electron transfer flavoprotein subunit alpha/FixB family protein [Alteromonas sp. a30]|uniref:electron transfer flavoprotein subunit alpha/FixB family protein n=1 Tax=Alteromonas sp. a30 TaxID=2730917 RepID=UPI00227E95FA|nr:electron transfer flavoprotein subunit alpha/FixB family protein [Alteromonas sp. a30]MCY7296484.1 electron transfer flavoprotein subunit alpha/FixB family protein [Alteromonas sp. a30]